MSLLNNAFLNTLHHNLMKKFFVVILFLIISLSGYTYLRNSHAQLPTSAQLNVVTTVAPLTNIVQNIGGDKIALRGLIPEGTDSHTFEPAPSDAVILSHADVIILNGLHLETPTEKLAEATKRPATPIIKLGEQTITAQNWIYDFSFPKEKGDPNPHLWMNPAYARQYAALVRDELSTLDPKNKDYYAANANLYMSKLDMLDQSITTAIQTIPTKNRVLLTYHDSWAYFAQHYGMRVLGAIQPSDFKEPRPQDVAALIDQIKRYQLPAIFGSEVFPSKVLDQIGREAHVQYVTTLRDDDLPGTPTDKNHTYIGMMLEDMQHMIVPLGGSVDALRNIDPSDISNRAR